MKAPPRPTATANKKGTAAALRQPSPSDASKPVGTFDDDYADIIAGRIMRDIATADERMLDRPDIGGERHVLPFPEFYDRAELQLSVDEINEAAATYTVAREATSDLLTILNSVLGTKHKLPEWSWM